MEKRSDGGFVFRGQRAEEREARHFHDHNNRTMEALYAEIQARMEAEDTGVEWAGPVGWGGPAGLLYIIV